jgi:undecaprenyl pyrophosphate synthase
VNVDQVVGGYDLRQLPYRTSLPSSESPEIGFVMNGGRRWALEHGASLQKTYAQSFDQISSLLIDRPAIALCGIYALTVYNLQRPRDQVEALLDSLPGAIDSVTRAGFTPIIYGDLRRVGSAFRWMRDLNVRASMVEPGTKAAVFAVAYSPFWERWARDDVRRFADIGLGMSAVNRIERIRFAMVLTSGGGVRLRDFLPLACGYAELTFTDVLFNDINLLRWYDDSLTRLAGARYGR